MISTGGGNKDVALNALRDEEQQLLGAVADLDRQAQAIQSELDGIHSAIGALTGKKKLAKGRRQRRGSRKGGASRDEVLEHVRAVLSEIGSATEDQLKERVGERVAAAGKSKAGLHITLRRIVSAGEELERDGEQLRLVSAAAQ